MSSSEHNKIWTIKTVPTTPYNDQKAGTSGLRKKVRVFQQKNYVANFVQSILDSLPSEELNGTTLIVSGDGRFFTNEAASVIIHIAFANGIKNIICGQNFLLSTPAVSNLIKVYKAYGAIIITASHNPGGIDADFGIKYNTYNGGPANETLTSLFYQNSCKITSYRIVEGIPEVIDTSKIGIQYFNNENNTITVIDPVNQYLALMKTIFNFESIKRLSSSKFSYIFDCLHGVSVPYAHKIFIEELGFKRLIHDTALPDFGGLHPDPNLTYASELVSLMNLTGDKKENAPDLGCACDGDADRNMIIGKSFFVSPSDSLAIIVDHFQAIFGSEYQLKGVARSMPTSGAVDIVATALNIPCFIVPTGWKFFTNLMDAGKLSICGEESFGTGGDHIREKDGIWTILCWLALISSTIKQEGDIITFKSVREIVHTHWKKYGRNYYTRYDYEGCIVSNVKNMFDSLISKVESKCLSINSSKYFLENAIEYSYTDPIDNTVSSHQGIEITFTNQSRIVYRKSGTDSSNATVRIYIEKYDKENIFEDPQVYLAELIGIAVSLIELEKYTGKTAPSVIT